MLKYLVLLLSFLMLPEITQAQTHYAVVDYSALTDSLYERFGGRALVDSLHACHWAKGERMVERFQQQVAAAQKLISSSCMSPEQQNKLARKLEEVQQEIVHYEEKVFNTAIPALDSSFTTYLNDLAPQIIRSYKSNQPGLKFFDTQSTLYRGPDVPDLTQELLAYIETQRGHRKRFMFYAASMVVSLGLNTR